MKIQPLSPDISYEERKKRLAHAEAELLQSLRIIPTYELKDEDTTYEVRFYPLKKNHPDYLPGFSHRVLIIRSRQTIVGKDWLSNTTNITKRAAIYYLIKHVMNGKKNF